MLFENKKYLINYILKNKLYLAGPGVHKDFYNFVSSVGLKDEVVLDVQKQVNQILKVNSLMARLVKEKKTIVFIGLDSAKLKDGEGITVSSLNKKIFNLCFSFIDPKRVPELQEVINKFYDLVFLNKKDLIANPGLLKVFQTFESYITEAFRRHSIRLNGFFIDFWEGGFVSNFHNLFPFICHLTKDREEGTRFSRKQSLSMGKYSTLKVLSNFLNDSSYTPGALVLFSKEGYGLVFEECKRLGIPVICIVNSNESVKNIDFPLLGDTKSVKVLSFYLVLFKQIIDQNTDMFK